MDRTKVMLFIDSFKQAVENNDVEFHLKRKSTIFLREIGWMQRQMLDYICKYISVDTYSIGPSPHHDGSGRNVMVFGIECEMRNLYVKLAFGSDGMGVCMSFHPAEQELNFPFKEGSELK